ncbi:MAG: PD40 domain-containing protein [Fibrobacterota bacterium]|nr:MAG: PD40 domain-containing protein [Fibrobacterota bacterium]
MREFHASTVQGPIMRTSHFVTGLLLAAVLTGCPGNSDCGKIVLPHQAFRLDPLNSPYDDWNSCDPEGHWTLGRDLEVLFSSNRATKGGTFDLTPMYLSLDGNDSSFQVRGGASHSLDSLLTHINSSKDELGPSFWFPREPFDVDNDSAGTVPQGFAFAQGDSGAHDLRVMVAEPTGDTLDDFRALSDWRYGKTPALLDVRLPEPINSTFDEGYATWTPRVGRILFHSNRSGTYRIWEAKVPLDAHGPFEWIQNAMPTGVTVRQIPELSSSDGQERCPYLVGNILYFVSDRSGGQGGLDVYRSRWDGTTWTVPENLGSAVNSSSDEYRPFALPSGYGQQGALIFSSNRPGGAGGFDLYMIGL